MDYAEAVRLAKAGEEKGFNFLYEETYKSKYYLALQYMKNKEAAEDVMQEAYIRALTKLDMLEQPEAFSRWFGTIVGNTAKNMLKKNNPMLFSDVAVDDEDNDFEYLIEDDNVDYQPEIAYTRQETQELVHELMDKLSEEQRMCILMYHIEGASIKEIASALDCSENTVKSRLKYGRDNLKVRAEELQKKGYKLYSIAPLPLLLYLLRSEATYLSVDVTLIAVGERMADKIFHSSATMEGAGISAGVQQIAGNGMIKAVRSGLLNTMVGKATAIVVGLCIAGGAIIYGVSQLDSEDQNPETEIVSEQGDTVTEESYPSQDATETEPDTSETEQDATETEQEEIVVDDWRVAYSEVIQDAPNQSYSSEGLVVVQPHISYRLLDMDGDTIPELIVSIASGTDGGEGTLSFRNSLVHIYTYSEDAGAQLKGEYVYYMPGFLRDENSNLIISSIDPFNGQARYYSVRMEKDSLYEEEIYNEQFPELDYASTFNLEHGFVVLEYSEVNDLTLILGDEAVNTESGGEADAEKEAYVGTYKNSVGDSETISITEDGQLKVTHRNSEYDIDINNKQEDGSIIACSIRNDFASLCIYIYPVGIDLSVYDHDIYDYKTTDENKIRLFITYQDVPDIKTRVYYKVD